MQESAREPAAATEAPDAPPTETGPPPPPAPLTPVGEPERIVTLDVLRGFAIFGIFMVNIAFFAMPIMSMINPETMAESGPADQLASALVRVLFEYKFVSLFSLLFGMGLVIQMQRAEAKGRKFAPVYLRRIGILFLIGAGHGFLLWYGDILLTYSVIAFIVFFLRKLRPKVLLLIGAGGIALATFLVAANGAIGILTNAWMQPAVSADAVKAVEQDEAGPGADVEPASGEEVASAESGEGVDDRWARFQEALSDFGADGSGWIEAEVIAYKEGPMLATLVMRAISVAMLVAFMIIGGFGFRVVAMFLFGVALMKLEFFDPRRRRWHRLMCGWGLGLGLIGELVLVVTYHAGNYEFGWAQAGAETLHQLSSFALCFGYIGTIALIVSAGRLRAVTRGLASVGRLALSNYLLQSIVATFIMYWWGLALFNDVSRPWQLGLVCGIYLGQIGLSVLWLKAFTIGPFEWLWRTLTYLKWQPMLRKRRMT